MNTPPGKERGPGKMWEEKNLPWDGKVPFGSEYKCRSGMPQVTKRGRAHREKNVQRRNGANIIVTGKTSGEHNGEPEAVGRKFRVSKGKNREKIGCQDYTKPR